MVLLVVKKLIQVLTMNTTSSKEFDPSQVKFQISFEINSVFPLLNSYFSLFSSFIQLSNSYFQLFYRYF